MNSDIGNVSERPIILLVEDEPSVRRSLQLLLHAKGYDIRSYASSAALIGDPLAGEAVCLITDYRMPEIDGLAVLRALRAQGWHKPAILITAYHSPELVQQATGEGFSDVLEKPLREHMLADAIARATAPVPPAL
ncbi:response regulator transcription factor [Sphingobium nicotianae]|uniref:Response regulator n=1 Tax=Sphingobium nicotianae TaxID=2782607 RepID=A0A9X1DF05_9SPHN|nr:response regulator [Sphingobium nicotianae]MBT2188343.1 response regulator [Sphingobium nicotianae]